MKYKLIQIENNIFDESSFMVAFSTGDLPEYHKIKSAKIYSDCLKSPILVVVDDVWDARPKVGSKAPQKGVCIRFEPEISSSLRDEIFKLVNDDKKDIFFESEDNDIVII